MSHYKPESPLSRLNREAAAGPVARRRRSCSTSSPSPCATRASRTAPSTSRSGPLMKAWGFFRGGGRLPSDAELDEVRGRRRLPPRRPRPGGADRPLRSAGRGAGPRRASPRATRSIAWSRCCGARASTAALVSAGGSTVYGLGAPPGRDGWDVERPGSRRHRAASPLTRAPAGPRALRLRQLREVVRAWTASATRTSWTRARGPAGAGHAERGRARGHAAPRATRSTTCSSCRAWRRAAPTSGGFAGRPKPYSSCPRAAAHGG